MKNVLPVIAVLLCTISMLSCKKEGYYEQPGQVEEISMGRGEIGSDEGAIGFLTVNESITINFNTAEPTFTGDQDLLPYLSFDKSGATPDKWFAIFNCGANHVSIANGATITLSKVNGYSPGVRIVTSGDILMEPGSRISVISLNKNAGDILLEANGQVNIDGEVRNEVTGTIGLPGSITIKSLNNNITIGQSGLVQDLGVDFGGNNINISTCGNDGSAGDITISGLVRSYAHAHAGDQSLNRPNIRVSSANGAVTINANSEEPLLDEFSVNGARYDIFGGLLAWVRDNVRPGSVKVQAKKDITVNGHGDDITGMIRKSFGAIAAVATASDAPGGIVDVRSLEGNIYASDRSFDVSGRNRLAVNYASIKLHAMLDIRLARNGANNSFNKVVDASSPSVGDKGGKTEIRSFAGSVNILANAQVSAVVPAGNGSVQGSNLLSSCTGVVNGGAVLPADQDAADDNGNCGGAPEPMFSSCDLN